MATRFDFGVAYPVKNHKFRNTTIYEGILIIVLPSVTLAPQATWVFTNSVNDGFVVQEDDLFTITNATGDTETFFVLSAIASFGILTIITRNSPIATFVAPNVGKFQGSKLAGSWERTGVSTSSATELQRAIALTSTPFAAGRTDNYGQVFRTGDSQVGTQGIKQSLDITKLIPWTYYRMAFSHRAEIVNIGGASTQLLLNDGTGNYQQQITTIDIAEWTEFNSNAFFVRSSTGTITPSMEFLVEKNGGLAEATFWVTDAILEHAAGVESSERIKSASNSGGSNWSFVLYDITLENMGFAAGDEVSVVNRATDDYALLRVSSTPLSGNRILSTTFISGSTAALVRDAQLTKKGNGVYTLLDDPIQPSINYRKLDTTQLVTTADNAARVTNSMSGGDRSHRWVFRCRFTTMLQVDWDALQVLMAWQSKGHLLTFHPHFTDLPAVLVGYMQITNVTKQTNWSLAYRDFDMTFTEARI